MFRGTTVRRMAVVAAVLLAGENPAGGQSAAEVEAPVSAAAGIFLEALQVNVVNIEVYVTDKRGEPVVGLTAQDFEVREDSRKVKLSNFAFVGDFSPARGASLDTDEPADYLQPLYVVLFVDNFSIDRASREQVLQELRGFVHRDRQRNVAYAVAVYDGTLAVLQPFTYDREAVLVALRDLGELSPLGVLRRQQQDATLRESLRMLRGIRRLTQSPTRGTEVPRYLAEYARQIDIYADRVNGLNQATFYAMSHLVNSLAALPGRKAVIYVSDGLPARPGDELYQALATTIQASQADFVDQTDGEAVDADIRARSGALGALDSIGRTRRSKAGGAPNADLMMLTALANASGVSFYAYKPQGNIGGVPPEFAGDAAELYTPAFRSIQESNLAETLHVLADRTGGEAIVGGEVETLMRRARADFSSYYSLGYTPDHAGDGQFHAVKVKVRGRGLKVRYRSGYVDKPLADKVADRTSTALLLGVDDNPLGMTLAVGVARPGERDGEWLVPVTFDVPLSGLALLREGDVYALDAQVYIAARSASGDMAPVQEGILRIEVPASEIERARREVHSTRFELALREGVQRLAIGFVDPVAALSSFVSRDLVVGRP